MAPYGSDKIKDEILLFARILIAHHYWTMTGSAAFANEINFYKNISIIGGLLVLYVAGAGRYSIDALFRVCRSLKLADPTMASDFE